MSAKILFYYFQVLHWIIQLSFVDWRWLHVHLVISFLFFLCTFFEKNLSQHFFFFLIWIVVLDIIIGWLVKNKVVIVVAIRIFVSDSSCLSHWCIWLLDSTSSYIRSKQKHSFMKSTDNWDFNWLFLRCSYLLLLLRKSLLLYLRLKNLSFWIINVGKHFFARWLIIWIIFLSFLRVNYFYVVLFILKIFSSS